VGIADYCAENNGTCDSTSDKCICEDPVIFTGTFCNLCQQNSDARNCSNNYQWGNLSSTCGSAPSMFNSSSMATFMETTEMTSSYQSVSMNPQTSMILSTTVIPTVFTNFYIQFTLSPLINDGNLTGFEISIELVAIFLSSFSIHSNQINISVTIPSTRILPNVQAQIRLFNSALESAESLLTRIRQQLADSTSLLRDHQITSQLTDQSISDLENIYVCDDKTEQETPCQTPVTTQSTSANSQTKLLLATIIPSIVGAILIGIIVIFMIKCLRQQSDKSSKYKQSHFDNPTTTL
jgi:hypothetical protein